MKLIKKKHNKDIS